MRASSEVFNTLEFLQEQVRRQEAASRGLRLRSPRSKGLGAEQKRYADSCDGSVDQLTASIDLSRIEENSFCWHATRGPGIRISEDGKTVIDTARKPATGDDGLGRFRLVRSEAGVSEGRHEWILKLLSPGKFLAGICTIDVGIDWREDNHRALHQISQAWVVCVPSDGSANICRWHRGRCVKTGLPGLSIGGSLGILLDLEDRRLTFTVDGEATKNSTFTDLPQDLTYHLAVSFGGDDTKGCCLEADTAVGWLLRPRPGTEEKTLIYSGSTPLTLHDATATRRPSLEGRRAALDSKAALQTRCDNLKRSLSSKKEQLELFAEELAELDNCRAALASESTLAAELRSEYEAEKMVFVEEATRWQKDSLEKSRVQESLEIKSSECIDLQKDLQATRQSLRSTQEDLKCMWTAVEAKTALQRELDKERKAKKEILSELQSSFDEVSRLKSALDATSTMSKALEQERKSSEELRSKQYEDAMQKEVEQERWRNEQLSSELKSASDSTMEHAASLRKAMEANVTMQLNLDKERERADQLRKELQDASSGFEEEMRKDRNQSEKLLRTERRRSEQFESELVSSSDEASRLYTLLQDTLQEDAYRASSKEVSVAPWDSNLLKRFKQFRMKDDVGKGAVDSTVDEMIPLLRKERNDALETNSSLRDNLDKERQRVEHLKSELHSTMQEFSDPSTHHLKEIERHERLLREERRRNQELQDELRSSVRSTYTDDGPSSKIQSDATMTLLIEERDEANKKLARMTKLYHQVKDDSEVLSTELNRLQKKVGGKRTNDVF